MGTTFPLSEGAGGTRWTFRPPYLHTEAYVAKLGHTNIYCVVVSNIILISSKKINILTSIVVHRMAVHKHYNKYAMLLIWLRYECYIAQVFRLKYN